MFIWLKQCVLLCSLSFVGCSNKVPVDVPGEDGATEVHDTAADVGVDGIEGNADGDCSDRIDNDGDGLVDCDDPGCAGDPHCAEASADSGQASDTGEAAVSDDTASSDEVDDTGASDTGMSIDIDGDGFTVEDGDCDDARADVSPSAIEVCDGIDNNCDGRTDEPGAIGSLIAYVDADGDGYGTSLESSAFCAVPGGYSAVAGDCDDGRSESYPGAVEVCDGLDNDCDSEIDEEGATGVGTYFRDTDDDGYGVVTDSIDACTPPAGYAIEAGDCDDADATVSPSALERCDGSDTDCDGTVDEEGAIGSVLYFIDSDRDGMGTSASSVSSCAPVSGFVTVSGDCDDTRPDVYDGAEEVCDGVDNDCDGSADEAGATGMATYYRDGDDDGYGLASDALTTCSPPGLYVTSPGDCDDADAARHPGATESCDGIDNDCDGATDEAGAIGATTHYRDVDRDGYGVLSDAVVTCARPDGFASVYGDCNPTNPAVHPGAVEVCDGVDNNCILGVDEAGAEGEVTRYVDADADGRGAIAPAGCEARGDCPTRTDCPSEFPSTGFAVGSTDCDDGDASVYLGAPEVCDGKDNDCDGSVDDGASMSTFYRDADGDGYGSSSDSRTECSAPSGYVALAGDCDDSCFSCRPVGTDELACDGYDNDCDGAVDEVDATGTPTIFPDADGDGFGTTSGAIASCSVLGGYASVSGDCDDGDRLTHLGASEVCDGVDNDCDGASDEGLSVATYYRDADGDGYGVSADAITSCSAPDGYVTNSTDCCDLDAQAHPGSAGWGIEPTACGGFDYNCDGSISEQYTTSGSICTYSYEDGTCNLTPGVGWTYATEPPYELIVPECGEAGLLQTSCTTEPVPIDWSDEFVGPIDGYVCYEYWLPGGFLAGTEPAIQGCR